ncbi:MerR family transcriptional regulator [Streptomyces sp. NPDC059783]|uniref:MerR family transcriptional regulator n=1 Tax=Streptomyces sp. NPDC059783 TaxID=3346944 RepID=UPI0036567894
MTTTWLTTAQAAAHADRARQALTAGAAHIRPATIRQWRTRGHLTPRGLTDRGHPLYLVADVARAEVATRGRALRLLGIPESLTAPTHP